VAQITHGDQTIKSLDLSRNEGSAVFIKDDFDHPGEVFATSLDAPAARRLTRVNDEVLAGLDLPPLSRMTFRSRDGLTIEGFLAKPAGWRPDRRFPLVVLLHGGPSLMKGNHWDPEYGAQTLLGAGVAVFMPNFRGSSGYGQGFLQAISGEWGGKAFDDVMSGLDAVLAANSWVDPRRLGITGISFGGFMTNWTVTQTNRFAAAVALSSISDFVSLEGTRDAFYGHAHDFGGDLFQNFDLYWRYSPIRNVRSVRTPMLIIHGEADDRVPIEQAEQWFEGLRHFGDHAELLIYPREGHGGVIRGEPHHEIETQMWLSYWFDKYLNDDASARAPDAVGPMDEAASKALP
jgi:dipeptidyl aminopeptidase/acylaminoacyl peptidase